MLSNSIGVIDRTASGTSLLPSESILMERRVIMLNRDVSSDTVNGIIQRILILAHKSDAPIVLVISSPGGEIQAGLALIDVMNAVSCPVYTVALGMAASMGAILLAAGTPGYRVISPHSRVMIHEPLLSNGVSGSCSTIMATAQAIMERKKLIDGLLVKYTGRSIEEIETATSFDHYMSAEKAAVFGIVDRVCEGEELMNYLKGVTEDDFG